MFPCSIFHLRLTFLRKQLSFPTAQFAEANFYFLAISADFLPQPVKKRTETAARSTKPLFTSYSADLEISSDDGNMLPLHLPIRTVSLIWDVFLFLLFPAAFTYGQIQIEVMTTSGVVRLQDICSFDFTSRSHAPFCLSQLSRTIQMPFCGESVSSLWPPWRDPWIRVKPSKRNSLSPQRVTRKVSHRLPNICSAPVILYTFFYYCSWWNYG